MEKSHLKLQLGTNISADLCLGTLPYYIHSIYLSLSLSTKKNHTKNMDGNMLRGAPL